MSMPTFDTDAALDFISAATENIDEILSPLNALIAHPMIESVSNEVVAINAAGKSAKESLEVLRSAVERLRARAERKDLANHKSVGTAGAAEFAYQKATSHGEIVHNIVESVDPQKEQSKPLDSATLIS